jgi:hypothetical protein
MQVSAPATQDKPGACRPAPGRDEVTLGKIASPLQPVLASKFKRDASVEAAGWYWQPRGATKLLWLGRNTATAAGRLAEHLAKAGS